MRLGSGDSGGALAFDREPVRLGTRKAPNEARLAHSRNYPEHKNYVSRYGWRGLNRIDGRTRAARYLKRVHTDLTAQLGGAERITSAQRFLIQQIASDMLQLELLNEKVAINTATEFDTKVMHALRSHVRIGLRELGLLKTIAPTDRDPDTEVEAARLKREAEERVA